MKTLIVTTTHDRPYCFSILEKWVGEQDTQPDGWLVVNDSERPQDYVYTMGQTVIDRTDVGLHKATRELPSLCKNWLEACKHMEGYDVVHVMEDDDYYDPRYISSMNDLLANTQLAGISHDVYFKLPTRRYVRMHNDHHASLASTSFRTDIVEQVKRTAKIFKSVFIDMYLWAEAGRVWPCDTILKPQPMSDGRMMHVGFKHMPGAAGLGLGHQSPYSGSSDPCFAQLSKWIGSSNAKYYSKVWQEHFAPKREVRWKVR